MDRTKSNNYNYKEPYKHRNGYNSENSANCSSNSLNESSQGCYCCDSDEDSLNGLKFKHAKEKCMQKCFRICLLSCFIIGYTFVGSVIFLVTEEAPPYGIIAQQLISSQINSNTDRMSLESKSSNEKSSSLPYNYHQHHTNESSSWFSKLNAENRQKTVQNIWEITVNLNILYKENWTRLAAKELNIFQERFLELLWQEKLFVDPPVFSQDTQKINDNSPTHWKLGKAFLYSISILATIGYGNSLCRSSTSKLISILYATIGLPIMFMYLSSMGSLLSTCARHVFSRTLCCCLCSKCGYCCYDEKLMEQKERRMRRKRELREYKQQMTSAALTEPFYVTSPTNLNNSIEMTTIDSSPNSDNNSQKMRISSDEEIEPKNEYSTFLAPLFVCITFTFLYIILGALVLFHLDENWNFLDSIYFCFMLVSTIGLGDTVPLNSALSPYAQYSNFYSVFLVWFFSAYIFFGLGLSATCFNIIHNGIRRKITNLYLYSANKNHRNSSTDNRYDNMTSFGSSDIIS